MTDPDLFGRLDAIPTSFNLGDEQRQAIDEGVARIFGDPKNEARECIERAVALVTAPDDTGVEIPANQWCGAAGGLKIQRAIR